MKDELIELLERHGLDESTMIPAHALAEHILNELNALRRLIAKRRDHYHAEQLKVFGK